MRSTTSPTGLRHLFATIALTSLVACGGGGSDDDGTSPSANTLEVSVSSDSVGVRPDSGAHHVGNPALVRLTCPRACTFTKGTNNTVTITQEATTSTQWTARLSFGSDASSLTVRADAADGSTATVVLRPRVPVTGTGTGTWSMDSLGWSRLSSTQGTATAYWNNQPVVTTSLVMTSSSIPCETASFRCSTVSVHFSGAEPGDYTIDPDFLTRGTKIPGTAWVNVKLTGGNTRGYYNDDYRPTSGSIRVTRTNGTYYFSTVGPMTVTRLDGPYGDPNAVAQMLFRLNNGF